jgi:hypothetical protein
MPIVTSRLLTSLAFSLTLASHVLAQQRADDPQRMTLTRLRKFAVYARVQLTEGATLRRIDEGLLRAKIEGALRREGLTIDNRSDVRDGSQASLDLLYMVMETSDKKSQAIFAASSCLQASQMVRIPRLTTAKHIAYAVVSTWRSCGLLVGDKGAYGDTILQNVDEQIDRFLRAWRMVNTPPPASPIPPGPELGMSVDQILGLIGRTEAHVALRERHSPKQSRPLTL